MPLHRRNSTGQSEGDYLEEIVETAEVEDDHLLEITCSAPKVSPDPNAQGAEPAHLSSAYYKLY